MPVFDYECGTCGHTDDLIVPPSQVDEPQQCPTCKTPMKKLFTTKRVGGIINDVKKLPNGDIVSRNRPLGSPNTWDRLPTKFREGGSA